MAKKISKPIEEDSEQSTQESVVDGIKPIFLNGDKLYMNRIYNRLIDEREVVILRPLVPKNGLIEELLGNLCRMGTAAITMEIKSKSVVKTNKKGDKKFNVTFNDLVIEVKLKDGNGKNI